MSALNGWFVLMGLMFTGCSVATAIDHVADAIRSSHPTCVCGKGMS